MIHHVRGMALGQYRRDIDPTCPDDEAAEDAIRAALAYARPVDEVRRDGKERRRAPERSGAPWSRMYILVAPDTGDVVGVMRASPRAGREDAPGIVRRPARPGPSPRAPGRPPDVGEARGHRLEIRLTSEEHAEIAELAARHGMTVSEWIRARARTEPQTTKAPAPKDGRTRR